MAEASTYSFDLDEATIALIKQQGIHEGFWLLAVEFGFAAALLGPAKEQLRPSAVVQINKLQLVRQNATPEGHPPRVNAAEVNPVTAKEPKIGAAGKG